MNFNLETLGFLYKMFGRQAVARMITIPGATLIAKANANKDEPEEIIAKRDVAVNAILDLVEEYANVDQD